MKAKEELKTLNEIMPDEPIGNYYEKLKAEAIKWVKYARKIEKPETFGWKECFRSFFNLTEEDLNDKQNKIKTTI